MKVEDPTAPSSFICCHRSRSSGAEDGCKDGDKGERNIFGKKKRNRSRGHQDYLIRLQSERAQSS